MYWIGYGIYFTNDVLNSDGQNDGTWPMGYWVSFPSIVAVHFIFLFDLNNWRKGFLLVCFLDILIYTLNFGLLQMSMFALYWGSPRRAFLNPLFWSTTVLVCIICSTPVIVSRLMTAKRNIDFFIDQEELSKSKLHGDESSQIELQEASNTPAPESQPEIAS
jgi:hypothetical protein